MAYTKKNFLDRLEKGNKTEQFLLEQLLKAGVEASKPEYPEGMKTSYYTKYQIDLMANGYVLEVKGRNLRFSNVADYPYKTLFVESTSGFDAKVRTPDFYVSVSNQTGAIIALDVALTKDQWTVEKITDRQRNYSYDMYIAPTSCWIDWDEFIQRLGVE